MVQYECFEALNHNNVSWQEMSGEIWVINPPKILNECIKKKIVMWNYVEFIVRNYKLLFLSKNYLFYINYS